MNPSPYRSLDDKYPYVQEQRMQGRSTTIKVLMLNHRSESWFGSCKGEVLQHQEYLNLIKRGDFVVDLGANEGYTAVLAAETVGPWGSVLAVEPAPHNWWPIKLNLQLNRLSEVVDVVQVVVGDHNGKIAFGGEQVSLGPMTEMVMLDTLLEDMGEPDVIKVDVEGFELRALVGANRVLTKSPPLIFLETHLGGDGQVDMRQFGDTPQMLWQYMTGLDYEFFLDGRKLTGPEQIPNGAVVLKPK